MADPHPTIPWRFLVASGVAGLALGVAFPFVRVDSLDTWMVRLRSAASDAWVDESTALTCGAFAITAAAAVYGFPRRRPLLLLALLVGFGVANEAWQAAFITRHAQLGDVAAAVLGATLGVGAARRLPEFARFGRAAAATLGVCLSLTFAIVLGLAVWKSQEKTDRFGTGSPDGFLPALVADHGGFEGRYRWMISVPFYTPERVLGRPDGRRGVPMGAAMTLAAGLAAAGVGRNRSARVAAVAAAATPPFLVVLASLLLLDTAWQGIPTGLTVGAVLAAGAVASGTLRP